MFWAIWRFLSEMLDVTYEAAWFMTHRIREAMHAGGLAQRNPSWTALSASLGGETSVTELAPPAQCTYFVLDYNPSNAIWSLFQVRKGDRCCTKACGVRGPYKSVPFPSFLHCTFRLTV